MRRLLLVPIVAPFLLLFTRSAAGQSGPSFRGSGSIIGMVSASGLLTDATPLTTTGNSGPGFLFGNAQLLLGLNSTDGKYYICGTANPCTGAGGNGGTGSGTVNAGSAYGLAYYPAAGTAVSSATPFDGLVYASGTSAPTAATAQQVASALGAAGGDLSGSYPNPTVAGVHATGGTLDGTTIGGTTPAPGSFTIANAYGLLASRIDQVIGTVVLYQATNKANTLEYFHYSEVYQPGGTYPFTFQWNLSSSDVMDVIQGGSSALLFRINNRTKAVSTSNNTLDDGAGNMAVTGAVACASTDCAGSVTLSGGTSPAVTLTRKSSNRPICTAVDTTALAPVQPVYSSSGTTWSVSFRGTASDSVDYTCIGR